MNYLTTENLIYVIILLMCFMFFLTLITIITAVQTKINEPCELEVEIASYNLLETLDKSMQKRGRK